MDCAQARQAIEQDHDGELDAPSSRALRDHLRECPTCAAAGERLGTLRSAVRDGATYFVAPDELRRRVAARAHASPMASSLKQRLQIPWWGFAGSVAAAMALSVAVTLAMLLPPSADALAREVVSNHVRSLMVDHVADVASTDQHTVKPWFAGKLDFSPPVHDFASEGYALIGGRLDYLDGRTVAALVYQRHQHRINVFAWPDAASRERSLTLNGYNIVSWRQDGMRMWAVSDLNATELGELRRLMQGKAVGG
jgi:anti-sigma factor RsiW